MSLKSELLDILDFPHERESYDYYLEVHTLGGELECYHMTNEGKEKLANQILDLLDKSLQEAYELGFNDASRKYNSSHDARIEKIPPHLRDEFEAEVRKVIKEEL